MRPTPINLAEGAPSDSPAELFSCLAQQSWAKKIPEKIFKVLIEILWRRNLRDPQEIYPFLFPVLGDIKDPYALQGMKKAVDRLVASFVNNEKICIYADFDLDGTSGLALLWRGMRALGYENLIYYQPKRLREGYGFHLEAVEELKRQNVAVIVTVDVGITAVEAVQRAQELQIDVILTDHHLAKSELPPAYVIVNPNVAQCPSGLGYLSGAGVAFYLLRALKRAFHLESRLPDRPLDLKESLEFFTIATITDMVPLLEDNRVLIKMGLKVLEKTTKPGLRALLEELGLTGRPLTSQDVAMKFAPKLNALSRMESSLLPIDVFLEEDLQVARERVHQVLQNNADRVTLQGDGEKEAFELLQAQKWAHRDFVFVASRNFHRGVIGLIATKLSQTMNRVALVGSINEEGLIVGSGRIPPGSAVSLIEALGSGKAYLKRFGGHRAAAGFELEESMSAQFVADLANHFCGIKQEVRLLQTEFDVDLVPGDLNDLFMDWYDFLGPFGVGFSIPQLRLRRQRVVERRELRGGHYKLKLQQVEPIHGTDLLSSHVLEALLFSPTEGQKTHLDNSSLLDLIGEPQWNYFRGKKTIQFLVREISSHEMQTSCVESHSEGPLARLTRSPE